MTVSYNAEVATCRRFGRFWRLLGRWRASIYKLIWMDLLVFLAAYYAMAALYRLLLNADQKKVFENLVEYCRSYGTLIPLSFVLGFFVAIVVERWWSQYITVPWPDALAVYVSALVRGNDEHGRLMRRTIMRYTCLSLTMVLTMISPGIKRRFPTIDYLVDIGLLNENERNIISSMDEKFPKHPKHWMPIMWASSIVTRARKEGRIWDDFSVKTIIDELNKFRANCNMLIHYDTISIPLVYTQVVTLAVYAYFLGAILGHQWIEAKSKTNESGYKNLINYYFPVFSTLEFFFFMGWLKVAETLICPFGDDDDDFELNWLIDRNLQVSYLIVDEMHNDHPELVRDQYWDEVFPSELPYNPDVAREEHPEASTAKLEIKSAPSTEKFKSTDLDSTNGDKIRIRFVPRVSFPSSESSIKLSVLGESEMGEEEFTLQKSDKDEFDLLREERERERLERQLHHAALTVELLKPDQTSTQNTDNTDNTDKDKEKEKVKDKEKE